MADKALGVFSDINIKQGDLTESDFSDQLQYGSVAGYSNFQSFIVGNYAYQKALFKVGFDSDGASVPRLIACKLTVDVPDIIDKGTETLSGTTATTIYFNRTFYAKEEFISVNATLVSGTIVAVPKITNITRESFDVQLIDTSGSIVSGQIYWQARGY